MKIINLLMLCLMCGLFPVALELTLDSLQNRTDLGGIAVREVFTLIKFILLVTGVFVWIILPIGYSHNKKKQ